MTLNLSADDVLTTTRSVRKRLDFERPVSRELLLECLELAIQAPSGSNQQGWQWIFVSDGAKKSAIADIYRRNFASYRRGPRPEYAPGDTRSQRLPHVVSSAEYLAEHMERSPWLLIPCIEGSVEAGEKGGASFWGSLLPATWSYMLALRARGLGSAWTTLHLINGGEQQTAEVLGIPYDDYRQGGLFPIAYTQGTDFKPAKRLPLEQITHFEGW